MIDKIKQSELTGIDFDWIDEEKPVYLCKHCCNEITQDAKTGLCSACQDQYDYWGRPKDKGKNILILMGE